MAGFVAFITSVNNALGRAVAWLCLGIVLLQVLIVLNRYCFGYGSLAGFAMINYEEALLYGFSLIFLMGAAYTYNDDGHVRVDIFYSAMRPERKDTVDFIGNLVLLLPLVILILVKSNRNLDLSWSAAEGSVDGGLPYVYLWQSMMPLFSISMAAQGIANAIRISLRRARVPRRAEQVWCVLLILLCGYLGVTAFGWSLDPGWTQPNPAWRFDAYVAGVWFVRLFAVGLGLYSLAVLTGLIETSPESARV